MQDNIIIPSIGFGVGTAWFRGYYHNIDNTPLNDSLIEQTKLALDIGYTHLDLAEMYGNDREVGAALDLFLNNHDANETSNPSKTRGDLWITSKVSMNYSQPYQACKATIDRLRCSYLDLFLLHCPINFLKDKKYFDMGSISFTIRDVWKEMELLVENGLVKHIGVSNFRIEDVEELLSVCNIPPYINQVEFNPYLQQPDLYSYCKSKNILLAAYAPLGPINLWPGGPLDPVIEKLSMKYSMPSSSILLRYASQKGYIVITTSSKKERLTEYLQCFTHDAFELTADELQLIDREGSKLTKRKYWTENF